MNEYILLKKDYSILRRIVNAKKENQLLVVTFDLDTNPIADFDLHADECKGLIDQKLAEYSDENFITEDRRIELYDVQILKVPHNISAKINPTKLGEFVLEQYDRNEKRFRNSEIRSWIAIGISVLALLFSIFLQ